MLFDFNCPNGHEFEELVTSDIHEHPCPECGFTAKRMLSIGHISYTRMGVDPTFTTAGDKWAKMQMDRRKKEYADKGATLRTLPTHKG